MNNNLIIKPPSTSNTKHGDKLTKKNHMKKIYILSMSFKIYMEIKLKNGLV